jgi:hypothetical protein
MKRLIFLISFGLLGFAKNSAQAGVFSMPHFVEPGNFSIGAEPEISFTNGAGLALNAKFTYGVNDLLNTAVVIGTGGGARQFRIGTQAIWDFFPDVDGQPGIGIGTQLYYYRMRNFARVEVQAVPYIHEGFQTNDNSFEPFIAIPTGVALFEDQFRTICGVSVGTLFKRTENLFFVAELGVNIQNYYTFVSGGVTYQY